MASVFLSRAAARRLFWLFLGTLQGCTAPTTAQMQALPRFSLGAVQAASVPASANTHESLASAKSVKLPVAEPTPLPSVAAIATGGGGAAAPAPVIGDNFLVLPSGARVAAPNADLVSVPAGLRGLVSYFAPGRVPTTVEAAGAAFTLHPPGVGAIQPPSGQAVLHGSLGSPEAGVMVAYYAPGRSDFCGTVTAADGSFSLEVPLDGNEQGMLVASDRQPRPRLAVAAVSPAAGSDVNVGTLTLSAPAVAGNTPPAPPAGLALVRETLTAFDTAHPLSSSGFSWGAPLLANDALASLPAYSFEGFSLATGFAAASPDGAQGSVIGGDPAALPDYLAAPDLSALPAQLTAGQALQWPQVPGATLYTISLSAAADGAPLWEAATSAPGLRIPAQLKLPAAGLSLHVTAWDVPKLGVYSVASLRALRLPTSELASGRFSWCRRVFGSLVK